MGQVDRFVSSFPLHPASVSEARSFVDEAFSRWALSEELSWTALQLVSELATNALIHARTSFEVEVTLRPECVRVCVWDLSSALPTQRRYRQDATTGRGMRLVDSLASCWGADPSSEGKAVWFALGLPSVDPAVKDEEAVEEVDLDEILSRLGLDDDSDALPLPRGVLPVVNSSTLLALLSLALLGVCAR